MGGGNGGSTSPVKRTMVLVVALLLAAGILASFVLITSAAESRARLRPLIDTLRRGTLVHPEDPIELSDEFVIPFRLDGRKARLRLPTTAARTVVEVGADVLAGRSLHVFEGVAHGDVREDREIGDPSFDRDWVVQGELADRVFAPESRATCVAALQHLRKYVDPCVEVRKGVLRVSIGQPPESELTVRKLVRAALALLEAAGPRLGEGMLWIEVRHDAAAVCQVCGTKEGGRRVVCRSCRTPHHADCWTYVGRCSTYGCGGRETSRA